MMIERLKLCYPNDDEDFASDELIVLQDSCYYHLQHQIPTNKMWRISTYLRKQLSYIKSKSSEEEKIESA